MTSILIVVGVVAFILIAIVGLYVTKYRTAGPDEALIVTGSYLGSKKMYIRMSQEIASKLYVGAVHSFSQFSNKHSHSVYYQVN